MTTKHPLQHYVDSDYSAERLIAELWIVGSWREAADRLSEWLASEGDGRRRGVMRAIRKHMRDDVEFAAFSEFIANRPARAA